LKLDVEIKTTLLDKTESISVTENTPD